LRVNVRSEKKKKHAKSREGKKKAFKLRWHDANFIFENRSSKKGDGQNKRKGKKKKKEWRG